MKKFFVFLLIVAGCLFLLYKTGNLPVDTIKAQIMSQTPVNNGSANITKVQPQVQSPVETQANGLPAGAVKEGKALIEGIVIGKGNECLNEDLKEVVKKLQRRSSKPETHIQSLYYSKTLGENVIIDAHIPSGERNFCKLDGTKFYGVSGESLINQTAEVSLQKYVAMKGLAKAIDGSK